MRRGVGGVYPGRMDQPLRSVAGEPRQSVSMTADRVLVRKPPESERTSKGGLLIPATATSVSKRCQWSEVVAVGPSVRSIEAGDQVLHLPESGLEVDIRGEEFLLLRERDLHAVASDRTDGGTGLYL
jgi:chaperonin GroES